MKVVNLTPHTITYQADNGNTTEYPASGSTCRVSSTTTEVESILTIGACQSTEYHGIAGLPGPEDDTIYLVSVMCLPYLGGRKDVVAPATGPNDGCIREGGRIMAVTRWNVPS